MYGMERRRSASQREVGSSGNLGTATCSLHAGLRRDAETERKFSAKLMSCRAEADGTLDGGEAEDNEEKRVCRVTLLVTHAKAC